VAAAAAYWLSLATGVPAIFPVLIGILDLAVLWHPRAPAIAAGPRLAGAIPPFLVLVAVLAVTQFPWNRRSPSGEFLLDSMAPFDDAVFHVGLARELAAGYPPQVPGLAGVPLRYHFGPGLVRAAALRWARIEPFDSISRVDPVVLGLGLMLILRAVASRIAAPPFAVALVPWTLLFTDFSFVFAGNPSAFYWTDLLKGNVLVSLLYVNPVVPGLLLACGTLVALSRFLEGEGRGWLALAVLQAAALPHFKVFLGAHLIVGLGVAAVLGPRQPGHSSTPHPIPPHVGGGNRWVQDWLRRWTPHPIPPHVGGGDRRVPDGPRVSASNRAILAVALPCAAMTALLALGGGTDTVLVSFAPFDLVRITRESLDLPALGGAALASWSVLWLLLSLGLRVAGLPAAVRALRRGSAVATALAAMALVAWPLGLLFRVAVREGLPGQKIVNDAAYFVEQGGPLLWVLAAVGLAGFAGRRGRALPLAACLLALPATVQFVVRKARAAPDPLPAAIVRATDALSTVARPGEVVLQRPGARYPPAPVLLAGLRVPYERYTPFRTQFASREFLERRHEAVFRFFRTEDPGEALAIARDLGASYVALYGPDRVRFDVSGLLDPVHEEEEARVYRLRPPVP
jgi:hypothetical protein